MRMKLLAIAVIPLILLVIVVAFILFVPQSINETGYSSEILAQNLEVPWALDFLPDDRMIFTERGGNVNILEGKNVLAVGHVNVTQNSESGLLGIAVDPNFIQNNYIYIYYTFGNYNRISRFKLVGEQISNETVLLDNIPASSIHNGGRLKFGPDGKLYATTGEAGNSQLAPDLGSLGGKILRINVDGSIPEDNPFGSYIYSYGHRDPQGITWSKNGTMYESEHGQTRNDEVNIIIKGGNYGWPTYEGNETSQGYIKPLRAYTELTLAPSGIAYYQGALYVAGLRGTQLRKITLSNDGESIMGEKATFTQLGRIREVVEHNGYLYITTSNRDGRGVPQSGDDKIIRIKMI
ncbi:MAG: glucose/sorbosone dehydrogenase [Methanobacterium sp. Maddingley MBC34]|nr:MAG: glucose/sorbosone dehydrogenase [Methanobacterium sp. Maddingley MBC34]